MLLATPTGYPIGYVREIRQNTGSTLIPFDHMVLSETEGSVETDLLSNVSAGSEIRASQQIGHLDPSCSTSNPKDWSRAYSSTGIMAFVFLGIVLSKAQGILIGIRERLLPMMRIIYSLLLLTASKASDQNKYILKHGLWAGCPQTILLYFNFS